MSECTVRGIVRVARQGKMTSRRVSENLSVRVSLRTLQRALQENEYRDYGHLKVRPKLEPSHVPARMKWAYRCAFSWARDWKKIIFSDAKKFYFDGPDGQFYFWGDERLPKRAFSKRARGGGRQIFWVQIAEREKPIW